MSFSSVSSPARVLLRLDDSSYDGGTMGSDHPIAWYRTVREGRSLYTGLGHTPESYTDPLFLAHLGGGLCWAARLACAR